MSQVFKLRYGDDIRRYRPETPIDSYEKVVGLVQTLFQPATAFDIYYTAAELPPILLSADIFPLLYQGIKTSPVITLTISPTSSPSSPSPLHPTSSPSPYSNNSPFSISSIPSSAIPSSAIPSSPMRYYPSLPVSTPPTTRTPPSITPTPTPSSSSSSPATIKAKGIEVPLKYRNSIWELQDEFPEATEYRVLTTLIKLGGSVSAVREELKELGRSRILIRDTGRRGRPKRGPAPPLYFPRHFQTKVKTLMDLGFEMSAVIDSLVRNGGSATDASLALLETASIRPSPAAATDYYQRAVETSYLNRPTSADTEPLDQPITMDQRIVDSLLLLERTHGFDRNQIFRAAESLVARPTPTPVPPTTSTPTYRPPSSPTPTTPPPQIKDQIFASIPPQTLEALATLSKMGFNDTVNNIILLNKHKGDLAFVIDELTRNSTSRFW